MPTELRHEHQVEIPPLKGFYRTPFGFYVADHKSPNSITWAETAEYVQRDGLILIPNSYWSRVATQTEEDIEQIENSDIREETRKAQQLMLDYPAQFVNLMAIGKRILVEPYGFGIKILPDKLKTGNIEVYDHDVSRIRLGEPQEKYHNAKLWVDESASNDSVMFAARYGGWSAGDWRFDVGLDYGPRGSDPRVAGLGFRPEGNQAYFDMNKILEELSGAEERIRVARNLLK